jgi:hypothetical protein
VGSTSRKPRARGCQIRREFLTRDLRRSGPVWAGRRPVRSHYYACMILHLVWSRIRVSVGHHGPVSDCAGEGITIITRPGPLSDAGEDDMVVAVGFHTYDWY